MSYQLLIEYRDPDCPRLLCSFRQMIVADWLSDFAFQGVFRQFSFMAFKSVWFTLSAWYKKGGRVYE